MGSNPTLSAFIFDISPKEVFTLSGFGRQGFEILFQKTANGRVGKTNVVPLVFRSARWVRKDADDDADLAIAGMILLDETHSTAAGQIGHVL